MTKTTNKRQGLFKKAVKINTLTLFLVNLLLIIAVFGLTVINTIHLGKDDLVQMMDLLSERVTLIGTPSRIAFSNVTLRDGLNFGLYAMDGTPVYLSSYGMPSTPIEAYAPKLSFFDYTDYTTFGREGEKRNLILHAACTVQNDENTLLLHVVSDITYLMTPIRVLFRLMLIYLPALMVIAIILGQYTSRKVIQPIHVIAKSIAEKTNSDLFERISLADAPIEFDDLINAFNSLMEKSENSFQRQKAFIANASHELRTPLAVISGHISMLQRWGKDDMQVLSHSLSVVQKETKMMTNMVQELLLLSRADRTILSHETQLFSVAELLKNVMDDAKMTQPNAQIVLKVDDNLLWESDPSLIKQVLRILMDNSMRYCPPPGVISLVAQKNEEALMILVQDAGTGIAPENLEHIFERFYRVDSDEQGHKGNSGLGLAIAKSIINSLGGEIHAQSELGKGTCMIITFPALHKEL